MKRFWIFYSSSTGGGHDLVLGAIGVVGPPVLVQGGGHDLVLGAIGVVGPPPPVLVLYKFFIIIMIIISYKTGAK